MKNEHGSSPEEEKHRTIEEFNELFRQVREYNDKFSAGAMVARIIVDETERHGAGKSAEDNFEDKEKTKREMHEAVVNLSNQRILTQLGIALEPVVGKRGTVLGKGVELGSGEIRFNLKDGQRMISFLRLLSPEDLKLEIVKENLIDLVKVFLDQLADHYDLNKPTDQALELLTSLESITNEYKRLNLFDEEPVKRLASYVENVKNRTIREYIEVEKQKLLAKPGKSFGPADWHTDATPDFLQKKWDDALKLLGRLKKNTRTGELYRKVLDHLTKCLEDALIDPRAYGGKHHDVLKEILRKTRISLRAFTE